VELLDEIGFQQGEGLGGGTEGRYVIAHVHEWTIGSGWPQFIDFLWASADTFRRSLCEWHIGIKDGIELSSSDPHLAVHEHGEQPVAEGGEFLVLSHEVLCSRCQWREMD
jgi:hypothetical protein